MVRLLKQNNVDFCFVYLSEYGSKLNHPIDPDYYKKLAPVLLPPKSLFCSPEVWMDGGHLNDQGAAVMSSWVAKEIHDIISECSSK